MSGSDLIYHSAKFIIPGADVVDFSDLPPGRGKAKSFSSVEGCIVLVQVADQAGTIQKLSPDMGTWLHCTLLCLQLKASRLAGEHVHDCLKYK